MPASASAQIGRLVKKKVKEQVVQTVAGSETAAAVPIPEATQGPVFTSNVLEITPDVLDRLERALAAEATAREENAIRLGKVLSWEDYNFCKERVLMSPEGQNLSQELVQLIENATTDEEIQRAMQEMATRMEAFLEPECGLEPNKAEKLRQELTQRVPAAAQEASGLSDLQLSILEERILPFCVMPELAAATEEELRIPGETSEVFYVYSPTEIEALRPRCGSLVEALQSGG